MQRVLLSLLLCLLGCQPDTLACPPCPPALAADAAVGPPCPPQPHPSPVSDACAAGEENLLKLACKDPKGRLLGGPDLHGVSWADICRSNKLNGVDMKPTCMAAAKSCAEVEKCR